jgi:beta-galactosidase/evolved beta-galactosidase subunit alpha
MQWSDATYLEDQDMWWLSGIFREVSISALPELDIYDVFAKGGLDKKYKDGILDVEVEVKNFAEKAAKECTVELELLTVMIAPVFKKALSGKPDKSKPEPVPNSNSKRK